MKVAGVFAGIGGFEHGLAAAGHESSLLCEIWEPARAVLAAGMPMVPCKRDVRDLKTLPKEVELLAGGFPCQDLSQAGQTAGIGGSRSGLVGEIFRLPIAASYLGSCLRTSPSYSAFTDRGYPAVRTWFSRAVRRSFSLTVASGTAILAALKPRPPRRE